MVRALPLWVGVTALHERKLQHSYKEPITEKIYNVHVDGCHLITKASSYVANFDNVQLLGKKSVVVLLMKAARKSMQIKSCAQLYYTTSKLVCSVLQITLSHCTHHHSLHPSPLTVVCSGALVSWAAPLPSVSWYPSSSCLTLEPSLDRWECVEPEGMQSLGHIAQ